MTFLFVYIQIFAVNRENVVGFFNNFVPTYIFMVKNNSYLNVATLFFVDITIYNANITISENFMCDKYIIVIRNKNLFCYESATQVPDKVLDSYPTDNAIQKLSKFHQISFVQ